MPPKNQPTKREWIVAYLACLEKTEYTGRVVITLDFNKGGIARAIPMREDDIKPYSI